MPPGTWRELDLGMQRTLGLHLSFTNIGQGFLTCVISRYMGIGGRKWPLLTELKQHVSKKGTTVERVCN